MDIEKYRDIAPYWDKDFDAAKERLLNSKDKIASFVDMLAGAELSDINSESARYDYSPVYHDEIKDLPSVGRGVRVLENVCGSYFRQILSTPFGAAGGAAFRLSGNVRGGGGGRPDSAVHHGAIYTRLRQVKPAHNSRIAPSGR